MTHKEPRVDLHDLPARLRESFAPLKKRALGLALGSVMGGTLFLVTAYHLVARPGIPDGEHRPFGDDPVGHLWLLTQFFPGYEPVTWMGAAFGFAWAFAVGFALGFAIAALRNVVVTLGLIAVRARGNLTANKGFLDQI